MRKVRLNFLPRIFMMLALATGSLAAFAQNTQITADKVYGYDPLLYNGLAYYFYPPPSTQGTQYMFDIFDAEGSVTVRGVTYPNQAINYDIYNQQLVLKYRTAIGSDNLLQISFAWLENFDMHSKHFEVITTADTIKEIFQTLGKGPAKVLYSFSRKLTVSNLTESSVHYFAQIQRTMYVSNGSKRQKYKNNRSFVKTFPEANHDQIFKYIRKNKLTVQKADDRHMTELINYCNTLLGT